MSTPKKQFMFVHIHKTAGTTVALILSRQFKGLKKLSLYPPKHRNDLLKLSPEDKNKFDLCYGHIPFVKPDSIARGIEYFTFFRDARERLLSGYKYLKSDQSHGLRGIIDLNYTLKDFLKEGKMKNFDNATVRFISGNIDKPYLEIGEQDLQLAIKNLDAHFGIFGLTEYFNESLVLLSDYMHWPPLYYVRENTSSYKIDNKELDEETEKLISACIKYDEVLYKHARERFLKLLEEKQTIVDEGVQELLKGNEKRKTMLSLRGKVSLLYSNLKIKLS